jgi:hypothetical protein
MGRNRYAPVTNSTFSSILRPVFLVLILLSIPNGCGTLDTPLTFTTIQHGRWLAAYEHVLTYPTLFVITQSQEIDSFAQQVIHPESLTAAQGKQLADALHGLNYDSTFAILAMLEMSGAYELTVQRLLLHDDTITLEADVITPKPG